MMTFISCAYLCFLYTISMRALDVYGQDESHKLKPKWTLEQSPLWVKILAVLIVSAPLLFYLYIILFT